jgi:hypothetical protein
MLIFGKSRNVSKARHKVMNVFGKKTTMRELVIILKENPTLITELESNFNITIRI